MQVKARHLTSDKPVEPVSHASGSLRGSARAGPKVIQDDSVFLLSHLTTRGLGGPMLVKPGRKSTAQLKDRRMAIARQEAEAIAQVHLRHRIADNERRHPEIFAHIRSEAFQAEYERKTGEKWDRRYESDMDELRARVLLIC